MLIPLCGAPQLPSARFAKLSCKKGNKNRKAERLSHQTVFLCFHNRGTHIVSVFLSKSQSPYSDMKLAENLKKDLENNNNNLLY